MVTSNHAGAGTQSYGYIQANQRVYVRNGTTVTYYLYGMGGERLMELLKQPQYQPIRPDHEVFMIYAGTRGYLDNVDVKEVQRWKAEMSRFMDTTYPEVGRTILETGGWNDKIEGAVKQGIIDFNNTWSN